MNRTHNVLIAAGLLLTLAACKPTENNYQAAYDAAQRKREQVAADAFQPAGKIMTDDAPMRVVGNDTVPFRLSLVRVVEGKEPGRYAVVVARYRMDTNARAQYENLSADPTALLLSTPEDEFFVAESSWESLPDAAAAYRRISTDRKHPPFVGLPDGPFIIETRH